MAIIVFRTQSENSSKRIVYLSQLIKEIVDEIEDQIRDTTTIGIWR
jgi:hypothetical protein